MLNLCNPGLVYCTNRVQIPVDRARIHHSVIVSARASHFLTVLIPLPTFPFLSVGTNSCSLWKRSFYLVLAQIPVVRLRPRSLPRARFSFLSFSPSSPNFSVANTLCHAADIH